MSTNETPTPRTDVEARDVVYYGDMGVKFPAIPAKKDPTGDWVEADFARQHQGMPRAKPVGMSVWLEVFFERLTKPNT